MQLRHKVATIAIAGIATMCAGIGVAVSPASADGPTPMPPASSNAPAAAQPDALVAPVAQLCTQQNTDHCINRAGGGTGNGTHLITYHQNDSNNDFTFVQLFNFCGGTGVVRNGEGGQVCPFRNGSGLNARYDGRQIFEIVRDSDFTRCAMIPTFSNGPGVALGNCGDQGYAWVYTSFNNVVSVGQSNWRWDNFHINNDPWWLYDLGLGSQLSVLPDATFTWICEVNNGGSGACHT